MQNGIRAYPFHVKRKIPAFRVMKEKTFHTSQSRNDDTSSIGIRDNVKCICFGAFEKRGKGRLQYKLTANTYHDGVGYPEPCVNPDRTRGVKKDFVHPHGDYAWNSIDIVKRDTVEGLL